MGILIDSHLNWSFQTAAWVPKLIRAVGLLADIRHYVPKNILRTIYYKFFSSLLTYALQIWGQSSNKHICRLEKLQSKAIRVMIFSNFYESVSPLYYQTNILKISNNVHDIISNKGPTAWRGTLQLAQNLHTYSTRGASRHKLTVPKIRTQAYGIKSIKYQ